MTNDELRALGEFVALLGDYLLGLFFPLLIILFSYLLFLYVISLLYDDLDTITDLETTDDPKPKSSEQDK